MAPPALTFWCELDAAALPGLFADERVLGDLLALRATVSLAVPDLSPARADVVRRLNAAGIPVVAWLLLPKEHGYYFNLDNAPHAAARYAEFQAWTAARGLRWAGVGLDIEPDLRVAQAFAACRWRELLSLPLRVLDGGRMRRARATYRDLVARMRADGYRVEAYQFHWIVDDRQAGSTVLQRVLRIVDVPVDSGSADALFEFPAARPSVARPGRAVELRPRCAGDRGREHRRRHRDPAVALGGTGA